MVADQLAQIARGDLEALGDLGERLDRVSHHDHKPGPARGDASPLRRVLGRDGARMEA